MLIYSVESFPIGYFYKTWGIIGNYIKWDQKSNNLASQPQNVITLFSN